MQCSHVAGNDVEGEVLEVLACVHVLKRLVKASAVLVAVDPARVEVVCKSRVRTQIPGGGKHTLAQAVQGPEAREVKSKAASTRAGATSKQQHELWVEGGRDRVHSRRACHLPWLRVGRGIASV